MRKLSGDIREARFPFASIQSEKPFPISSAAAPGRLDRLSWCNREVLGLTERPLDLIERSSASVGVPEVYPGHVRPT